MLLSVAVVAAAPAFVPTATAAAQPTISIRNVSVEEGDAGTAKATFVVKLSRSADVKVHYRTRAGTATLDDFERTHGTIRFTKGGATSRRIVVRVTGDTVAEADETFTMRLTKPRGAALGRGVGRATIVDDDDATTGGASLSIGDLTIVEGNTGTTDAVFDVTLSASAPTSVTVDFAASNGTAGASDYNPAGGTLVFSPGDTAKQVTVQVIGDTLAEPSENFRVTLSEADGATIVDAVGLGTITDDDSGGPVIPSLTIGNATVTEGNSGSVSAVFTVTLSAPSSATVTVDHATAPGSATAPADYASASGTLTLNPGETSHQVVVQVQGDTASEANETFSVNLSNATNATIADASGLGTITDNDTASISIGASTVTEGNVGTTNGVFNLGLSAPSSNTVTVDYATANGSATAPADYVADSGTVTFNPGEVSKQIVVQVAGDIVIESNETYSVSLSNPTNATIAGSGFGLGTITDDDNRTISIGNSTVTEANAGTTNATFTVTLSASSGNTVTVNFSTADGSAVAPGDYVALSGTVTFNPGETTKQIVVQIVGELVVEPNETYSVTLSDPTNATISGSGIGLGTITNND
jgi:chitinase